MIHAFKFVINHRLEGFQARAGVITTPHGDIQTPAFIPVGTRATVKGLTPEQLEGTGAQAALVNAYHLYLRPSHKLIDKAGGIHTFMKWPHPIFSDSGGFQVMSLGVGMKKVIDMVGDNPADTLKSRNNLTTIDDGGVTFKSHLDGSLHRFTPELSMQIQHGIGADITFAFDELTTLHHNYAYQLHSLDNRTHPWAIRSLKEHRRLNVERAHRPPQALYGVVQGAHYEDLRRKSARFLSALDFDGYGLGGAFTKHNIGEIVGWICEELPDNKPRHMLGISEPDDIFSCIENGADTFDCVSPARVARNGALYTRNGRINIRRAEFRENFNSFSSDCACYTCKNYTCAYLHHLFRVDEMLGKTLATIHNEQFIVTLVADIRKSIIDGSYVSFKKDFLATYYSTSAEK